MEPEDAPEGCSSIGVSKQQRAADTKAAAKEAAAAQRAAASASAATKREAAAQRVQEGAGVGDAASAVAMADGPEQAPRRHRARSYCAGAWTGARW